MMHPGAMPHPAAVAAASLVSDGESCCMFGSPSCISCPAALGGLNSRTSAVECSRGHPDVASGSYSCGVRFNDKASHELCVTFTSCILS